MNNELEINSIIESKIIGHIDPKGPIVDGRNPSGVLALVNKNVKLIEDINRNEIDNKDFISVESIELKNTDSSVNDYGYILQKKINKENDQVIFTLILPRHGDVTENITIQLLQGELIDVFIQINGKHKLNFTRDSNKYIVDLSYIPLIALQWQQIKLDFVVESDNKELGETIKTYIPFDKPRVDVIETNPVCYETVTGTTTYKYPNYTSEISIHCNYMFLDTDLRRKVAMNIGTFTIQNTKYKYMSGMCSIQSKINMERLDKRLRQLEPLLEEQINKEKQKSYCIIN